MKSVILNTYITLFSCLISSEDQDDQAIIEDRLQKAKLFAYHLEQSWGLGQCEEDVIILYSEEDNVVSRVDYVHLQVTNHILLMLLPQSTSL